MRRLTLLLMLTIVYAGAVAQTDLYKRYSSRTDIRVASVTNFVLDSTGVTTDVTLLEALDDEGWEWLSKEFGLIALSREQSEELNNGWEVTMFAQRDRHNPALPAPVVGESIDVANSCYVGVSYLSRTLFIFTCNTAEQSDVVIDYLIKKMRKSVVRQQASSAAQQVPKKERCGVATGTLIFVKDTAGMGQAVAATTGKYTHVGIVICTDSGEYVYEALPKRGVICRPLKEWSNGRNAASKEDELIVMRRPSVAFDTVRLLRSLKGFVGTPYDDYFMPNNGRLYCSELVYECYFDKEGNHIFEARPMNFNASNGKPHPYWVKHFKRIAATVPQGVPGTNPSDIFKETKPL